MPVLLQVGLALLATLYALGFAMALDAIWNTRTSQGTMAWVFALVFFAPISVVFYAVFGTRRFHGYVRARRRGNERIHKLARDVYSAEKPFCATDQPTEPNVGIDFLGLLPMTTGNSARLLVNGDATFKAIFAAMDAAKDYILVQFYIINDDELGCCMLEKMSAAVTRGVRVFVLYDEIGSSALTKRYLRAMDAAGVVASGFRTTRGPKNRFQINFRNHRKIVVCDGLVGFLGGHNVGDEYMGKHKRLKPWRDTHIELRGPSVQAVQMSFVEDWNWAVKEVPANLNWTPKKVDGKGVQAMIVPSGPADDVETFALLFLQLAHRARKRLWVATPYFVPDEASVAALQLAALRGVDVRVLLPEISDFGLVIWAAYSYYPDILPVKVKVYRHQKGFMHQKVFLADDAACISTANLDNRSLRINFEVSAVVRDEGFADEVAAMLELDMADCKQVPPDGWTKLPVMFRLRARVARLLAPIL